ncbi:DUF3859 domain-containing protein [Prolixibacteraceae bacterium]|nr:DUF3859 domain-containing protein [Prolixibacteraceae bacterium]
MRPEEADTKFELCYVPWDIDSMKQALEKYAQLISTSEAFIDSYCVAHFTPDFSALSDGLKQYHKEAIEEYTRNDECHTGEYIFYKIAIDIPGLKSHITNSCKAIVNYARMLNNSSYIWLTCEEPFGINPLYITASKYPEYGYLIASFLVAYWDTEHMFEPLEYLYRWSEKIGITNDSIKAFCYCDNNLARELMLGYNTWDGGGEEHIGKTHFDLITHFRTNTGAFDLFKEILIQRLKDMPILMEYEDQIRTNPIKRILMNILYPQAPYKVWDDNFDLDNWLTNTFIDTSIEKEIEDTTAHIEKVTGCSITSFYSTSKLSTEDLLTSTEKEEKEEVDGVVKWYDLFLKIFPNGTLLWNYVQSGENHELLNDIEKINLVELIKEQNALYAEEFEEACEYNTPIQDELSSFLKEYHTARREQNSFLTEEQYTDEILRIYDVIHRSLGNPVVSDDLTYYFSRNLKCIHRQQITTRYPQHWKNELYDLITSFDKDFRSDATKLQRVSRTHKLIVSNRKAASELILKYFQDKNLNNRSSIRRRSKRDISKVALSTVAVIILYFDERQGINDHLTIKSSIYLHDNFKRIVVQELLKGSSFPDKYDLERYSNLKSPSDQHELGQQSVILSNHEKWNQVLLYLEATEKEIESNGTEFQHVLQILKKQLHYDDRIDIAEDQRHYNFYEFKDKLAPLIITSWLICQISNAPHKEFMRRWIKLSFHIAPMRTANIIELICPTLKSPHDFSPYKKSVDAMKTMGMPDEAYWAYQLQSIHKSLVDRKIDLSKLDEEFKHVQYYTQLIKLHVDSLDNILDPSTPLSLVKDHLERIKTDLDNGIRKYIERRKHPSFVFRAMEIFGHKVSYQNKLDSLAIQKLERDLSTSICWPEKYYENYLNDVGIENNLKNYYTGDASFKSIIEKIKTSELSDEQYESLKRKYFTNSSGWTQSAIVLEGEYIQSLYNTEVLNYFAAAIQRGETFVVSSLRILYVAPCAEQHLSIITSFDDRNFDATIMEIIDSYLNDNKPFSHIEKLIKLAIWPHGFYGGLTNYDELSFESTFLHLSSKAQEKILNIICTLHIKDVDQLFGCRESEGRSKIASIMFENNMNPQLQFKLYSYSNNRRYLAELAKKHDCTRWIKECDIDTMIFALASVSYMPKYHPLLIELKDHKSLKIKRTVNQLIKIYKVNESDLTSYQIIDYGIFKMGEDIKTIEGKENVTKEAKDPVCIEQTTEIKATINSFIGLRFTARYPDNVAKVCEHKVIVTHPSRNSEGKIVTIQSGWQQNGYSNSAIFLGWSFDTNEELLAGEYHFVAYDLAGKLLVEKKINVTIE